MKPEDLSIGTVTSSILPNINDQRLAFDFEEWSEARALSRARRMIRDEPCPFEVAGVQKVGGRWLVYNRVRFQTALGFFAIKRYPFDNPLEFLRSAQPNVAYRIAGLRECFEMRRLFRDNALSLFIHREKKPPQGVVKYGKFFYIVTGKDNNFGRKGLASLILGEGWDHGFIRYILQNKEWHDLKEKPFWYLFEQAAEKMGLD